VKYLRHPLLVAWLAITIALASILIVIATHPAATVHAAPAPSSAISAVVALRLDFADLGPAALYGGASWGNVVKEISRQAKIDVTRVPATYAPEFSKIVSISKLALTDKTSTDRWADLVALTAVLDRLTITAGSAR
jgi:hypothetical protein